MARHLFRFVHHLKLRWKLVVVVLPLVLVPIILVGAVVGGIATRQAYRGITQTSRADLDHMAAFTLDLLDSHHRQFEVYKRDKQQLVHEELATLAGFAYDLVAAEHRQVQQGPLTLAEAQAVARKALREVSFGESGYLYAMTSQGVLTVHLAREGEDISDARDENGRPFIRQMCERALRSEADDVMYMLYPWRNEILGDAAPRRKIVAYRYFREWDWILAAGSYLDETYEDIDFERQSFELLKANLRSKKVGRTGYIFCMDSKGTLTVHPESEGQTIFDATDSSGHRFIAEMCEKQEGWIRYPWQNERDRAPRMKVVRYVYFPPWDWIVAVGSYEEEFYREANLIKDRILISMLLLPLVIGLVAVAMVFLASRVLSQPIQHMIEVIRRIKGGRLDEWMQVDSRDELGELAASFNRMTDMIQRHQAMEAALAHQGKMASLGVLASGVAHEINNPLGVILGYAGYMERKLDPESPLFGFVHDIKRESKRCKKIVQDLLSYARTPKPSLEPTDLNSLLAQILDFAANHVDMHRVKVIRRFDPDLPVLPVDGDQIRQVAINLVLNAGAALPSGGTLEVVTRAVDGGCELLFRDDGPGISAELVDKIFEPFFTTKEKGTGLGLAITRQIVEQHHGTISVESREGVGSCFTVRLPLHPEEG